MLSHDAAGYCISIGQKLVGLRPDLPAISHLRVGLHHVMQYLHSDWLRRLHHVIHKMLACLLDSKIFGTHFARFRP